MSQFEASRPCLILCIFQVVIIVVTTYNIHIMDVKTNILHFKGKGPFNLEQAKEMGISHRMLSYYVQKGMIEKIAHGVYAFPEDLSFEFNDLIKEKLKAVPQAVIGLETALKLYDLTDEAPATIDLIVPLSNVPKKKLEDIKIHQIKDELHKKDIKKINTIPVTSLERTLIELLRKRKSVSMVLQVLKTTQAKGVKVNLPKMKKMAKEFRVQGLFDKLMDAYL